MFENFGFVSGVCFGLVMGGFTGMVIVTLLNMGGDHVNEIIINASYQLPPGYCLAAYVWLGHITIKVLDNYDNDTGYIDNLDLEIDARLLLAQAHAENYERQHLEEMVQDQVAA